MYSVPKLADYSPAALEQAVRDLLAALDSEAVAVTSEADYKTFRDRWMARKNGVLTQVNDLWLKAAPPESKAAVGQKLNWLKSHVAGIVEVAQKRLLFKQLPITIAQHEYSTSAEVAASIQSIISEASTRKYAAERLDVTLPGIRRPLGVEHPVIRTMNTIVRVFQRMGYSVGDGPEIETDYYNFEALNFPPNHPARDTQDTIFIAGQEKKPQRDRLLLRTHTSPVQIHTMERQPPPVRIVIPGKVYRHDTPDATHSPVFHQVEGLVVDTNITFRDLKGTLDHAMKALFGSSAKTRFFPSFFPFTEPSADVAVTCFKCGGKGHIGDAPCRLCKQSGWIELLGSGMVDPNVFQFVKKNGYDPAKVSGFAFGMGVERIAMAIYGIDDIQLLYSGDVRFLEQFA